MSEQPVGDLFATLIDFVQLNYGDTIARKKVIQNIKNAEEWLASCEYIGDFTLTRDADDEVNLVLESVKPLADVLDEYIDTDASDPSEFWYPTEDEDGDILMTKVETIEDIQLTDKGRRVLANYDDDYDDMQFDNKATNEEE